MTELTESIAHGNIPKGIPSDWLKDGTLREVILREYTDGEEILKRLKIILCDRFHEQASKEYDPGASVQAVAFSAGYRKALKDIYRLIQLDT